MIENVRGKYNWKNEEHIAEYKTRDESVKCSRQKTKTNVDLLTGRRREKREENMHTH